MANKRLLVCDLDNTLYDWVGYFVASFYAMVDAVVNITGCDREVLLNDFRKVHQLHHDSEHPFALLETETVQKLYKNAPIDFIISELNPALHAFNSSRKKHLKLYEGVLETLKLLKAENVRVIAHTESKLHGIADRLNRLGLFDYFSKIYCRERSLLKHPSGDTNWLDKFPMEKFVELSHHQTKPNPTVLTEICASEGIEINQVAYVGDSMARDMLMAKRADVFAIWAAYGTVSDSETYSRLVRISHWTSEEVENELRLREEAKAIQPNFIAQNSFAEVLEAIQA